MDQCRVVCEETGAVLAEDCELALTTWQRFRGLMLRGQLPAGAGMLFPHCSSIHMFFMRFPVDLVYLDREGQVVKIVRGLKPWRISLCPGARSTLELPAGTIERVGLEVGQVVYTEQPTVEPPAV
jgi:hypothetical protein